MKIEKVVPNENGEIEITMYSAPGSQWGYLNTLVLQAYPNMQDGGNNVKRQPACCNQCEHSTYRCG